MNRNKQQNYGIYVRESSNEASSQLQLEEIRSALLKHGVGPSEIKIYAESDKRSRAAFQELLQDLKSTRISSVACWRADHLDNIFDDLQVAVRFLSLIEQSSGQFIAVADDFNSGACLSPYTSLLELFQSSKERLRGERARLGLLEAKENGRAIGRPRGGFDAKVLEFRAEGKSIRGISEVLKIPTSTVQSILERCAQTQV